MFSLLSLMACAVFAVCLLDASIKGKVGNHTKLGMRQLKLSYVEAAMNPGQYPPMLLPPARGWF